MKPSLLQSIIQHGLLLGAFALVTALMLGVVEGATEERIEQQRLEAERRALAEVMSPDLHDNDLLESSFLISPDSAFESTGLLGLRQPRTAYVASFQNKVTGIILPVEAHDGYAGTIVMLVGILDNGNISGVRVLQHKETPGLGDKIDMRVSDWILVFNGTSLNQPDTSRWKVRKDGGDFDQFTGATITPRAVVTAVRKTLEFFQQNKSMLMSDNLQ